MMRHRLKHGVVVLLSLLAGFVMFTQTGFAQKGTSGDPTSMFYKGNALYEEGKYNEASRAFESVLDRGLESGNLYYNIGNCYFKKGELGRAILNYERAERLIPRDSDLRSNYSFALSRLQYDISETSSWMKRIINIFHFLSLNEMTILLSAVFGLLMIFLILRLFIHRLRRYTLAATAGLIVVIMLLTISLAERITLLDTEAVVIAENPEVRFEPLDNATVHFTLYEGMKITTLQSNKEWTKIKRADGKVGWIKSGEIEKIRVRSQE